MGENEKYIEKDWENLLLHLKNVVGKKPDDITAVLFLIGIQELGVGKQELSKEQKQDTIHVGTCSVLSLSNFYVLDHYDEDGWPHYESIKKIPVLSLQEQDVFLKMHILEYFSYIQNS